MTVDVMSAPAEDSTATLIAGTHTGTVMSILIAAGIPGPMLRKRVESFKASTLVDATEIVVACDAPWRDAPAGVRVVVTGPVSRGDKLDLASESANGELLAFVDEGATLSPNWQLHALKIFQDSAVGAAGGPILLPPEVTNGERAAWLVMSSRLGSGSLCYRFQRSRDRTVTEMSSTNLVVRRQAFRAVGGFQCPSPFGDDTRLCYKLRTLLGLRVRYAPGLAVTVTPPSLPQPFLSLIFRWGRHRGDLMRRLPEVSPRIPYVLPPIGLLFGVLMAVAAPFSLIARLAVALVIGAYVLAAIWLSVRGRHFRVGVLSATGLLATHVSYAAGFWNGYLGRSLGEIGPGRFRKKPMRILIFNWRDVMHPWAGGAEAYMHELARRWVRAGCEVGWLSARHRSSKRVEVIDGVRVHRIGGQFSLYPLAAIAYLFRMRNRYDVVIDCENGIPFFTPLYTKKPVILVVFHLHAEVIRQALPPYVRWLVLWLEGWLMPRLYREKKLVTISPSTFDELVARGYRPARITVVSPGVDLPSTPPTANRSKTPLLLYLGRLKPYKRVDVLLQAMPRVLSVFPDASLAIVGQGPDRERLERLAWTLGLAGTVRFFGYVEKSVRDELLGRAWTVVVPSAFEGWGIVCLEANAWGVPVVAARVAGLRDAVKDGVTGVLVPYGSSDKLADTLVDLLADAERRQAMGQSGREWAAAHDWDRSAEAFLQILIESAPRPVTEPQDFPLAHPSQEKEAVASS